jgi:hypothetical protein
MTRKKKPSGPVVVERPLWVLTAAMLPRLVAMRTRGRPPVVLSDVRYFAHEGDRAWRPIGELQDEKGGTS